MHPQSHTPYSPDRATVADDCLSAFNESKLGKRSKFETRETIDCRVKDPWLSCPKTNARTPYTTLSTTLAVARVRELRLFSTRGLQIPHQSTRRWCMLPRRTPWDAPWTVLPPISREWTFLGSRTTPCWSVAAGRLAFIGTASSVSSHSPQYSTMNDNP